MLSPSEIIRLAKSEKTERHRLGDAVLDVAAACRSVFAKITKRRGFVGVILGVHHDGSLEDPEGQPDSKDHSLNLADFEPLNAAEFTVNDLFGLGLNLITEAIKVAEDDQHSRFLYYRAKKALDRASLPRRP